MVKYLKNSYNKTHIKRITMYWLAKEISQNENPINLDLTRHISAVQSWCLEYKEQLLQWTTAKRQESCGKSWVRFVCFPSDKHVLVTRYQPGPDQRGERLQPGGCRLQVTRRRLCLCWRGKSSSGPGNVEGKENHFGGQLYRWSQVCQCAESYFLPGSTCSYFLTKV